MKINELSMGQLPEEIKSTMQIYLDYTKQMKGMVSWLNPTGRVMIEATHLLTCWRIYGSHLSQHSHHSWQLASRI